MTRVFTHTLAVLRLLFFGALFAGCVPYSTGSTEVGVRVAKLGFLESKGVLDTPYPPGTTTFFPPVVNSWYLYDTALQNLVMTRDTSSGDRQGDDALGFKTVDGNDISVDVTVAWAVDPAMVAYLLQFVGPDTTAVGDKLVRPVSRTLIRDVLNELASEQYYDANVRFQKAEEATRLLNHYLNRDGVVVKQVLLGEHKFSDEYEGIIRDKKVAEQDAARLQSETEAAYEQMRRELEVAKGEVSKAIETSRGEAQQKKIAADALYYERERQAQAILAERQARAQGISEQDRALAGTGGTNMVKLEVARALKGKPLVFLPSGSGMDLRTTNVNSLLETYGVLGLATPTK